MGISQRWRACEADLAKLADNTLRTPKCSRCRNHGFLVPVKGHSGKCSWKHCTCEKCYLITERQKIMAAQKVLKKQAAEEDPEAALCAPGPPVVPRAAVAATATTPAAMAATAAAATMPGPGLHLLPPPLAAAGGVGLGFEGCGAPRFMERPPRGRSPGPSAFQPVPSSRGQSRAGPSDRTATASWLPGCVVPPLPPPVPPEPVARPFPCRPELRRPLRPVPTSPFADFRHPLSMNSSCVVGTEYMERESSKLYPSCSTMHSYCTFSLGYQDTSPGLGLSPQRSFRHVSCSHYHGGGLVSEPVRDFQPTYYPPPPPRHPPPPPPPQVPQPQFLPPGFLSALHFLPPPPPPPSPPPFSLAILSDTDRENIGDQGAVAPQEPSQPSSQEKSN
ncbi:LOW QUALITY PROTEIN: doublesex- and mab-3-related transcription factor B1 [Dipodomys spectabilis]|uniref:LOW QUALITY PROTEIN: doublesex- and mab-3-related transcription factor B1 n=1 Tax=Dipodomys spectabilis TaxID=105255 RepID=UPI001C5414F2|nr:LOW QUALITY PROTEIN: doublesex- and mab-3-related transcription factor B1 [Dipodomys spectabilis]